MSLETFSVKNMSRIKLKPQGKISPAGSKQFQAILENVAVSYAYVTTNKSYSYAVFEKVRWRDELEARRSEFALVKKITGTSWKNMILGRKEEFGGSETIPKKQICFQPLGIVVSDDEKVYVLRFGEGMKYRLLGVQRENVLCVIGYDFSYSAYSH